MDKSVELVWYIGGNIGENEDLLRDPESDSNPRRRICGEKINIKEI